MAEPVSWGIILMHVRYPCVHTQCRDSIAEITLISLLGITYPCHTSRAHSELYRHAHLVGLI